MTATLLKHVAVKMNVRNKRIPNYLFNRLLLTDCAKDNVPYLLATAANRSRIKRESEYNILLSLTNIFLTQGKAALIILAPLASLKEQDNVQVNMESVQCISIAYSGVRIG